MPLAVSNETLLRFRVSAYASRVIRGDFLASSQLAAKEEAAMNAILLKGERDDELGLANTRDAWGGLDYPPALVPERRRPPARAALFTRQKGSEGLEEQEPNQMRC